MAREDLIEPLPRLFSLKPNVQNSSINGVVDTGVSSLVEKVIIENCGI